MITVKRRSMCVLLSVPVVLSETTAACAVCMYNFPRHNSDVTEAVVNEFGTHEGILV